MLTYNYNFRLLCKRFEYNISSFLIFIKTICLTHYALHHASFFYGLKTYAPLTQNRMLQVE